MKNSVLGAAIETQMNTQLLFCIQVNNGQTWKLFHGFQFSRFPTYREIRRKLDDAKISHFTVFWSKFETFDREITIEYKQIPKRYFYR